MKHISLTKQSLLLVLGALATLLTGCIKDDLAECSKLTLRVENAKGDDITAQGLVESASLYIFDANRNYLETRLVDKSFILSKNPILLDGYPDNTKLHIVAWANMKSENQQITDAKRLDELTLSLKSEAGYALSPDSLYYGNKEVTSLGSGIAGGNGEIAVRIKTGVVTIKTLGLQTSLKSLGLKSAASLDFYLDRTLDAYDYAGTQTGDSVAYNPDGTFDTSMEWMTQGAVDNKTYGGVQNVFAGKNLGVAISKDGQLLKRVTVAEVNGVETPIEINEGERRDLILIFQDGNISARMRILPWGVVDDDIDFGK